MSTSILSLPFLLPLLFFSDKLGARGKKWQPNVWVDDNIKQCLAEADPIYLNWRLSLALAQMTYLPAAALKPLELLEIHVQRNIDTFRNPPVAN